MTGKVAATSLRYLCFLTQTAAGATLTPVYCCGSAMQHDPGIIALAIKLVLLSACLSLIASPASGQKAGRVPVTIFGDGNPENGVEDSREQLMGGRQRGFNLADQRKNAGSIKCDGKIRGTAMVVDSREFSSTLEGVVLASAAHVLYDLDKKQRFRRCDFHFLALAELARYRARIDLRNIRSGNFDPTGDSRELESGEGDWVFLYLPEPWKNFDPDETIALRDFSFLQMESYRQSGGEIRLIAYDSSAGVISVSRNCQVTESRADDLGGGAWKGQLLDDCDSTGGASGGGIVAVMDQQQYLIGIRSGSHWSAEVFPASEFPSGPPDGSVWSRRSNTNFGRAIDAQLLAELSGFIKELERKYKIY